MYHAYRSSREVPPFGWRNRTIALLEPGDRISTRHVVPSGPVKERMGFQWRMSYRWTSAGLLRLAPRGGDDADPVQHRIVASPLRSQGSAPALRGDVLGHRRRRT